MRLVGLLLLCTCLAATGTAGSSAASFEGTVPGQLLVRLRSETAPDNTVRSLGTAAIYNDTLDLWRLEVPPEQDLAALTDSLRANPDVEFVQPQYRYVHADHPTDDLYQVTQRPYYQVINLPAAWEEPPGADVVVAVVDGGADVDHPELLGHIWQNTADPTNGADDDNNGCIDDTTGCSFHTTPPSGAVADEDGHGTFVSGIIAANWDGVGTAGIARNALIMPVRALDGDGKGTTEQLAASVLYAARNGAQVINMSLILEPVAGTCPRDDVLEEALKEAHDQHGATIVAAAGNFSLDCVGYPASSDYAIAVAASSTVDDSDSHAFFSHWGPEIDVAAPGERLVSTCPVPTPRPTVYCPGEAYGEGDGTSFSSPIAAGVAAMLLGLEPQLTPDEVAQRLRDTARDVPDKNRPNWDGAGIIDAAAAIGQATAFAHVGVAGDNLAALTLDLVVGDPANPACADSLWAHPDVSLRTMTTSLGAESCADFWPPSPTAPWYLRGAVDPTVKTATLNDLTFTDGAMTCAAADPPAPISHEPSIVSSIDCTVAGILGDGPDAPIGVPPTLPRRYRADLSRATAEGDRHPLCDIDSRRSLWYEISPPAAKTITVDTIGSRFDSGLVIYRRDGADLTEIACNDDALGGTQSRISFAVDGASTYLVRASTNGLGPPIYPNTIGVQEHTIVVNFSEITVPANDVSATPLSITETPLVQQTRDFTAASADPTLSCFGPYVASGWYTITPTASGPVTLTTAGSDYDTIAAVFEGSTEIACNDNASPSTQSAAVQWDAVAGHTYTVLIAGRRNGGLLHLSLD